jgi:hypothetical protein
MFTECKHAMTTLAAGFIGCTHGSGLSGPVAHLSETPANSGSGAAATQVYAAEQMMLHCHCIMKDYACVEVKASF